MVLVAYRASDAIPAGMYIVEVDRIEYEEPKPPYNQEQLRVYLNVVDDEYNKQLSYWVGNGTGRKYRALWLAFGVDCSKFKTLNTDKLQGRQCQAMITVDQNKSTGDPFNKVLELLPLKADGAESATGKATTKATAPADEDPFPSTGKQIPADGDDEDPFASD